MKLRIFKNGINVTETTFCTQIHYVGTCVETSKWFHFVAYNVRYTPSYRKKLFREAHLGHFIIL